MMWRPDLQGADMICPQCEKKFPWHVMVCPTCDRDTVDRLPGPEPTPDIELVPVFATRDPALIALAQSLLDGEEIDYLIRDGAPRERSYGIARATGYEFGMGPAQFWVRADDAERVKGLFEDLSAADQERDPPDVQES
jgi:hypothetical protein